MCPINCTWNQHIIQTFSIFDHQTRPTLQLDQHAYNAIPNKLSKTEGFHKHSPLHKHTQVYTCEKHSLKLLAFSSFFFLLFSVERPTTHTHSQLISESRSSKNHTACRTHMKLIKHYHTSCDKTFIKTAYTHTRKHTQTSMRFTCPPNPRQFCLTLRCHIHYIIKLPLH